MRRFRLNAIIGGVLLALFFIAAVFGALWTPYNPSAINLGARLIPPNAAHWCGTDEFGRDVLSRLLVGSESSLSISMSAMLLATIAGTVLGAIAGYAKGIADRIIMVLNGVLMAFPGILLALGLLAILGPGPRGITLALGLAFIPPTIRIVRGEVLSLREKEFVESSRSIGNSEIYTLVRHVLPNCLASLSVLSTSMIGWGILTESALSYLGLGAPPPAPTWGNMLSSARPYLDQALWLAFFPGLTISLALLGINLFGDALRDWMDPRMRGAQS